MLIKVPNVCIVPLYDYDGAFYFVGLVSIIRLTYSLRLEKVLPISDNKELVRKLVKPINVSVTCKFRARLGDLAA